MIDNDNNDVFGDDDNDDDDDDNDKVRSLGSMVVRTLSKVSRLKGTDSPINGHELHGTSNEYAEERTIST